MKLQKLNKNFCKEFLEETKIKTNKFMLNRVKHSSEAWVWKKRDIEKLQAAKMSFLGYLLSVKKLD